MTTGIVLSCSDWIAVRWNFAYRVAGELQVEFSGVARVACRRKLFHRIRIGLRFDGFFFPLSRSGWFVG